MPYEPTPEDLERLVAESFNDSDIAEKADQAGLAQERIVKLIADQPKEIWESAASNQVQVEKLEAEYESKLALRIERSLQREARILQLLKAVVIAIPILSVAYFVLRYFNVPLGYLTVIIRQPLWLGLTISLAGFFGLFGLYNSRHEKFGSEKFSARHTAEKEDEFLELAKAIAGAKRSVR